MDARATRRQLISRAVAVAAGAAAGGLASAAPALAASETDPELVAKVLGIEQLLVLVYGQVLLSPALEPAVRRTVRTLLGHEREHVASLTDLLIGIGGIPPAGPSDVRSADAVLAQHHISVRLTGLRTQHDCLKLLVDVESIAEGAYYTSIQHLSSAELLSTASSIMACEAQHWTVLTELQHPGQIVDAVPWPFVWGSS